MFNLQFEKYLTKNGTISPNSPLNVRAEYYVILETENPLSIEKTALESFDIRPEFLVKFTGHTEYRITNKGEVDKFLKTHLPKNTKV